jgi:4-hydroxy-tetrahydrodipicolinate synthase
MREIALQCRAATVYKKGGSGIDEDAFRQWLQRFIDTGIDVYLCSAGSGEGHSLTNEEIVQVYKIGVAHCKGKIEVNANPPDQNTARKTIEQAQMAADAGVDIVNIYQPASWHGYQPKGDELVTYYETILKAVKHQVALAPNPVIGTGPTSQMAADLCKRFPQIASINLVGQNESYFLQLKAALTRDVRLFVDTRGIPNTLALGAAGLVGGNLNVMPKTYRAYADAFAKEDVTALADLFAQMIRTNEYTKKWSNPGSRMIKMFMHHFKLPGWEGGVREPCLMPPDAEIETFAKGLGALRVAEFDEIIAAARH